MPPTDLETLKLLIKWVAIAVVIGFGFHLFQEWRAESANADVQKEKDSVSMDASIAGGMLLNAFNSCSVVELDVDRCSVSTGNLVIEQSARTMAKLAVEYRETYLVKCKKHYADEYCTDLLGRAVQLSYREQHLNKR